MTKTPSIHQLRKSGYKVRVKHERILDDLQTVSPRGGRTVIELTTPDQQTFKGEAMCNAKVDNFNKKIANQICLGRIFKQIKKAQLTNGQS